MELLQSIVLEDWGWCLGQKRLRLGGRGAGVLWREERGARRLAPFLAFDDLVPCSLGVKVPARCLAGHPEEKALIANPAMR